ncbi:Nucleolar protein 13 [Microbotryomycetes sp. JL221]|nr:Nucleolar protein 13 [Microbotryomycetes sp. JL221]
MAKRDKSTKTQRQDEADTSATQETQQEPTDVAIDMTPDTIDRTTRKKSSKRKLQDQQDAPHQNDTITQHDNDTVTSMIPQDDDAQEGTDEQVLSHKERRLAKRRKLKQPDADESTTTTDDRPSTSSKAVTPKVGATPAKSAFGVWIGNLTYSTTSKQLLDWLADKGLKEVTRVNMPKGKRSHEHNKGYVYVDFATETEMNIAVGLSEQHLDGRKLLIKSSTDYTGRPSAASAATALAATALGLDSMKTDTTPSQPKSEASTTTSSNTTGGPNQTLSRTARKILDRQKNPPGPTLFLGNLGFETTVDDIQEMFEAHQRAALTWQPKKSVDKKETPNKDKSKTNMNGDDDDDDDDDDKEETTEKVNNDTEQDVEASEQVKDEDDADKAQGEQDEESKPKRVRSKKRRKSETETFDSKVKQETTSSSSSDAGIKKVRLGTFEDSGKCKGWAFVDFRSPEHATRALLNPRNHTLLGRSLTVEFASLDAVRRGGFKVPNAPTRQQKREAASGGTPNSAGPRGDKRQRRDMTNDNNKDAATTTETTEPTTGYDSSQAPRPTSNRPSRTTMKSDRGHDTRRAKPGAALASAQRASEAIVASRGKKIVFE